MLSVPWTAKRTNHGTDWKTIIMIIIGQFIKRSNIAEVITRALNIRHSNSLQISRPKVYL